METLVREVVALDRMAALEAALAAIGGSENVVVRADEHAVDCATGYDATRRTFDFEGTTYVAEKRVEGCVYLGKLTGRSLPQEKTRLLPFPVVSYR